MRSALKLMVIAALLIFGFFSSARAQERHIVPSAAVDAAVQRSNPSVDRAKVREFLARPEVQQTAERAGLGPIAADPTVAALDDAEVQSLAARIDAMPAIAGGDQVVVISTTAIIIGLLILIVILVA